MNNLVSSYSSFGYSFPSHSFLGYSFLGHSFANCIFTGGMTLIISMFFSFVKKSEEIHQKYLSNTNLIIRQNEQLNKLVDKIISLEQNIADLHFELEKSKKKLFINSTILEPILEEVLEDGDQHKDHKEEVLEEGEEEEEKNLNEPIEKEKETDQNKEIINEKMIGIHELLEPWLYKGISEENTISMNDSDTDTDNDLGFEFVDKSIRHNRNKRVYKWYNYFY